MSEEVAYWLLCKQSWNFFKPTEYLCLVPIQSSFAGSRTTNPKLAQRWFTLEDARAYADLMVDHWTPKLVLFDGDELARVG